MPQVTLILPVAGQRGMGQAEVVASEGQEGISQMKIQVSIRHAFRDPVGKCMWYV